MNLNVNQTVHAVGPDWQGDTLLAVLREHLGLCGPKYGCGLGECGACTVIIDGIAARSCVIPISGCVQRDILTLEGLGSRDHLDPVQKAFIEEQAFVHGDAILGTKRLEIGNREEAYVRRVVPLIGQRLRHRHVPTQNIQSMNIFIYKNHIIVEKI